MARQRRCPLCGSEDITTVRAKLLAPQDRGRYEVRGVGTITENRDICGNCGHMELWVDPREFAESGAKAYWKKCELEYGSLKRLFEEADEGLAE